MSKRFVSVLAICLLAATAAQAQSRGGGGGGGGRGGGRSQTPPSTSTPTTTSPVIPPAKALNTISIVGEIKAIDADNNRITIAYEPVEALNWPAGTMPFVVSKAELLKGATLGEKVRFKLESQQISELAPY